MRDSQHRQAIIALFLLGLIALSIVFVYAQTIDISKQIMDKRTTARTEENLTIAVDTLQKNIQSITGSKGEEIYSALLLKMQQEEGVSVESLDTGKKAYFYNRYLEQLKEMFDNENLSIIDTLSQYLPKEMLQNVVVSPECTPELSLDYDESKCVINKCCINNVVLQYLINDSVYMEKSCSIDIPSPNVTFIDESVDFFDYCLVGMKGIYVTGETSTLVGSMYAGTHTYEEGREAEVAFGEKDPYGGVNFLTTQVGVYGDSIVTTGDLNLKGAFVLFGSEDDRINLYANTLNEIENYPSKTKYEIVGDVFFRDGSVEYTNEEHYNEILDMIDAASWKIDSLSAEYDSKDDESYTGEYEKIITSSDVTLTEDFTGVIIAKGNVIIESGCNVEGMIMAGDRIYVYGNNNIVSNRDVLRAIITQEIEEDGINEDAMPENSRYVKDYIGGLVDQGVIE